jgi:hypothetical protein
MDGTEFYGEWVSGRKQGKGTIWFANRSSLTGKFSGHLVDNTLTMEGQLLRDAEPTRVLSRKRVARWENWFQLKAKLIRASPVVSPAGSISSLEPFGLTTSQDSSPIASSPSSLHSSTASLGTRDSVGEQLLALASLGAADATAAVLQHLRTSELLSGTLADWAQIINGLYGTGSERVVRIYSRLLEDVQSFLVALGMQLLRSQPELNTEAGLDATWLALELSALPLVYDTVFAGIRRKVGEPLSAVFVCVYMS